MTRTPAEQIALDMIFNDYECHYPLLDLFFKIIEFEEDGIHARDRRDDDEVNALAYDKWHRIECRETGYPFEVCYHTTSEEIEWRTLDNSWRYNFLVHKATFRPDLVFIGNMRFTGEPRGLRRYATALKTAQPYHHEFRGFQAVELAE